MFQHSIHVVGKYLISHKCNRFVIVNKFLSMLRTECQYYLLRSAVERTRCVHYINSTGSLVGMREILSIFILDEANQ